VPRTYTRFVRSRSSRNGQRPVRIVLHTTEGLGNVLQLANFFDREPASSHLGVQSNGDAARMVPDSEKSWTEAAYNPGSLSIEQIGYADYSTKKWVRDYHHGLLRTAAAISNWAHRWGIPIRHGVAHGVCQHKNLGAAGGGHHDCGSGYPERYVLYLARLHFYRHHRKPSRAVKRRLRYYKAYCSAVQRRYAGRVLGTSF
jgi:hypothetical protein